MPGSNKDRGRHNKILVPVHLKALMVTGQCYAAQVELKVVASYALKKARNLGVSTR